MLLKKIYEWISDKDGGESIAQGFGLGALMGALDYFMLSGLGIYVCMLVMYIKGNLNM